MDSWDVYGFWIRLLIFLWNHSELYLADKLLESQRSYGFIVQTLIIGIGTWIA